MFGAMSYSALQIYWWFIISLLGALLVFMMFVQGGQTLVGQLAKNDTQRKLVINAVGSRWDITFTTLVTFGGAFFASFPLFYATSFSGAYWVWMLILFSFIIQAVSYEYREKARNFLGTKTYDAFLFINGLFAPLLLGAAVGTFFTGAPFKVNFANVAAGKAVTQWVGPLHGLEAVLFFNKNNALANIALGIAVVFLTRVLGNLFVINRVDDEEIVERASKQVRMCTIGFLVFFLFFIGYIFLMKGFDVTSTGEVVRVKYKYFHNFLQWYVLVPFLVGVVLFLYGVFRGAFKKAQGAFWWTSFGTVLVVLSLFFMAGYNHTPYYPSWADLNSSLTIHNSSSSKTTLVVMSYVSLLVPFVLAYIWYAWSQLLHKKFDKSDVEGEESVY